VLARQVDRLSSRFDTNANFDVTAREFHATKKVGWSDHYAKRWMERLEKDIFPWLGQAAALADRRSHAVADTPAGRGARDA
jgi:hypothetical protein